MIAELLPPATSCAESFEDHGWDALYPEERALVRNAVESRRQEFATARACARAALAGLGLPRVPILPGVRNVPQWPSGVVGSLTHCAGYRAAAVARTADFHAIGIDAEPNEPLPDGVLESIATAEDLRRLDAAPRDGVVHWPRLLFSAKESVYKAWFPMTGIELDFPDATVHAVADREPTGRASAASPASAVEATGSFTARIRRQGRAPDGHPVSGFSGRWLVRHGIIVTTATLPVTAGG